MGEVVISKNRVNITAHAGCMGTRMDSLKSIEAGIKYGADILEIDLNIDEIGNLIICHDEPKPQNEYVRFYEMLEIIKKKQDTLLNIDIKDVKVLKQLKSVISDYGVGDRVFFTGLNFLQIMDHKEELKGSNYFINLEPPKLNISKLNNKEYLRELMNELLQLKIMGININYRFVTEEMVKVCNENSILSSVWTVDDVEEMKRMININVSSITTKQVDLLKILVEKNTNKKEVM